MNKPASLNVQTALPICQVIKGETIRGSDVEFQGLGGLRFAIPKLDMDSLVWSRQAPGPAFDTKLSEIVDLLVELGSEIRADRKGYLAEALDYMVLSSPLDRGIVERSYAHLPSLFDRNHMLDLAEGEIGDLALLDGWREVKNRSGGIARIRAFPPRLVHILAGNAPGVGAITIIRGAFSKGVHLMKLPSNDLFTTTAILRILADIAPGHPVTRSFSAVYWRGGDAEVEGMLFRPQFFDKLVAWGGESAIRSAKNYIGPGFELVSFDPKNSISFIGREVFQSPEALREVAAAAATDATLYNQSACVASRFQYIEGSVEDVDRYCEILQQEMGVERATCSVFGPKVSAELREEIDSLRGLEPMFRVWGSYDGKGLVIRSDEPVDFYPDGKIVNVVRVKSLVEATKYANVATQTVGVYPSSRKAEIRDLLASAGTQRVVALGKAMGGMPGLSHDGFFPLHRFVRWVNDEG